ncbi:MAG: prepilin-type N-terminal cleavage/methylation domain-containing protein [bacterium]
MKESNNNGFSLIEVMIAIALVGILASLATTSYTIWVKKARMKEAISTIRILYDAAWKYKNEAGNFKRCSGNSCFTIYRTGDITSYLKYFFYEIDMINNKWLIIATTNGTGGFPKDKKLRFNLETSNWDIDDELIKFK